MLADRLPQQKATMKHAGSNTKPTGARVSCASMGAPPAHGRPRRTSHVETMHDGGGATPHPHLWHAPRTTHDGERFAPRSSNATDSSVESAAPTAPAPPPKSTISSPYVTAGKYLTRRTFGRRVSSATWRGRTRIAQHWQTSPAVAATRPARRGHGDPHPHPGCLVSGSGSSAEYLRSSFRYEPEPVRVRVRVRVRVAR